MIFYNKYKFLRHYYSGRVRLIFTEEILRADRSFNRQIPHFKTCESTLKGFDTGYKRF